MPVGVVRNARVCERERERSRACVWAWKLMSGSEWFQLWRHCRREKRTFRASVGPLNVKMSPVLAISSLLEIATEIGCNGCKGSSLLAISNLLLFYQILYCTSVNWLITVSPSSERTQPRMTKKICQAKSGRDVR